MPKKLDALWELKNLNSPTATTSKSPGRTRSNLKGLGIKVRPGRLPKAIALTQ